MNAGIVFEEWNSFWQSHQECMFQHAGACNMAATRMNPSPAWVLRPELKSNQHRTPPSPFWPGAFVCFCSAAILLPTIYPDACRARERNRGRQKRRGRASKKTWTIGEENNFGVSLTERIHRKTQKSLRYRKEQRGTFLAVRRKAFG